MICDDWSLVKSLPGEATIGAFVCKRWTCETCGPELQKRLRARAYAGTPSTFLTLTSLTTRPGTPDTHAQELSRSWRLLRLRILRELTYPDPWRWPMTKARARERKRQRRAGAITPIAPLKSVALPFLAVFEQTDQGEPHLHVLLRAPFIPQRWLSAQMDDLMGSPIVDIRKVHTAAKVAAYVTKYIGKDPHRFAGCNRFWCSRDWLAEDKRWDHPATRPGTTWFLVNNRPNNIAATLAAHGWTSTGMDAGAVILAPPPRASPETRTATNQNTPHWPAFRLGARGFGQARTSWPT